MAAEASITVNAELTGLGKMLEFAEKFTVTTTPTAYTYNYRTLATADTAEALDLGDVTIVHLIIIKAIASIYIDTSYVSTFVNEIVLHAGEVAVFKPAGTVYIKNYTAAATPTYEYVVVGIT